MSTISPGAILAVTLVVPDPDAAADAYAAWLHHRSAGAGRVDAALAQAWDAPAAAGARWRLLEPASGEPVYLRFVAGTAVRADTAPLRTLGWNATEILVEDPDALAARLAGSPFRVVGPPRDLEFNPKVRAMQVLGPGGELLYLTRIPPGASAFDLGTARASVDRTFIVVAGGRSIDALCAFWRDVLGLAVTAPRPTRVEVLNEAWGLDAAHRVPLAIARLPSRFLVELDEYPAAAAPRPTPPGGLPPGMAIVSFTVEDLDGVPAPWLSAPRPLAPPPYDGRRAALLRGAAGELVELVESRPRA